ncbi:MAG: DNA polymerase IV, partial [Sphingobacteriaceae bacterium]
IESFMEKLPVEKFYGVGKVTAGKMKRMGLHTGADLKKLTEQEMTSAFGKPGRFYYQIIRGVDDRAVQPHRETKSMGAEDTFAYDLTTIEEMHAELDKIATTVVGRLEKYNLKGRTITLKIKYHDFRQITRNQSFTTPVSDMETITATAKQLLLATQPEDVRIRLLGISLSNFGELSNKGKEEPSEQLRLDL